MNQQIKRTRDERIRIEFARLRMNNVSSSDAIALIQTDRALNPMGLSETYIRRFIVFAKTQEVSQ